MKYQRSPHPAPRASGGLSRPSPLTRLRLKASSYCGYHSPTHVEDDPIHPHVMTTCFKSRLAVAALALGWAAWPLEPSAHSANQLGAWDGLILSPAGASPPVAAAPGGIARGAALLPLLYGRWLYAAEDAVHDN